MGSSGPRILSCRFSLGATLSVTSGASKFRPNVLAYFFRIMSRTSSTKSPSCIVTKVADAPGRLTHIFLLTISALMVDAALSAK
jgi:hypothetical protein